MTVAHDIRALAPASEKLGITDAQSLEAELDTLLPQSTWSSESGHSTLNGNGSPIELCVSVKGNKIRGRLLVDPCHTMRGEARYHAAWETAFELAKKRAPELLSCVYSTHALVGELCPPEAFPNGPLWLASVPDSPGMAMYCDSEPFAEDMHSHIDEWLKRVAPQSRDYFATLLQLKDKVKISSFGIEGYRVDDARVKIYFRLKQNSSLQIIGVEELYSPPIIEWIKKVITRGEIHPDGLVLSISAPLQGPGDTDAKADICGHCVAHTLQEWDDILAEIQGARGLPRFSDSLEDNEVSVAFAGLGVTSAQETRVNVYLQAVR